MSRNHDKKERFLQGALKKQWIRICILLVLLVGVFLLVLPHALRIGAERWLLDNGADQATVGKIGINLFTAEASITGVRVTLADKTVLADSGVYFNLSYAGLLQHKALVESASLHNIVLDIEQFADGRWRFGSIFTRKQTATEEPPVQADSQWIFASNKIELFDCTIRYTRPDLNASLVIDHAILNNLTSAPADEPGSLVLKGRLNAAPLDIQMDTIHISPNLEIGGRFKTSGIQLDDLSDMLQDFFRPFSGKLALEGNAHFRLTQENEITSGYTGNIKLAEPDIGGQGYAVLGKEISWNGGISYRQEQSIRSVGVEGRIEGTGLRLNLEEGQIYLQQESAAMDGKVSIAVAQGISLDSEANITLKGMDFTMPLYHVENDKLTWQGKGSYSPSGPNLLLDGTLELFNPVLNNNKENNPYDAGSKIIAWHGQVEYDGAGKKFPAKTLYLNGDFTGTGMHATFAGADTIFSQDKLVLTGNTIIPLPDIPQTHGEGTILSEGILLSKKNTGQKILSLDELSTDKIHASAGGDLSIHNVSVGRLELANPAESSVKIIIPETRLDNFSTAALKSFSLEELSAHELVAENTSGTEQLAFIRSIRISNIKSDRNFNVTADQFLINDAGITDQESSNLENDLLRLSELTVDSPRWSRTNSLQINKIGLDGLKANIIRSEDGSLNTGHLLQQLHGGPAAAVPEKTSDRTASRETPSPLIFRIDEISVTGESKFSFQDLTLETPFLANLSVDTLHITGIDAADPDKPASYELSGSLDKDEAPLVITGTVTPVPDNFLIRQKLSLQNYPMIHLAPYSVQYLGITPTQGTLGVDSDLHFENGSLDLEKKWLLKKLAIKTVDRKRAEKFNSQLPMSLESAISLLKDKNENIELSVPISGSLDDLDFGITDFFITPLSKAIVSASSSYLLYALGPYGAAAFVGMKLGEKLMETRLPAVEFEPGQRDLTEEHKKYLERIAEILRNRPGMDLQICPYVLPGEHADSFKQETREGRTKNSSRQDDSEKEAEQPAESIEIDGKSLSRLANARASAIKNYLIQAHDIEPGRLILCLMEIDTSSNAVPRVELKI